MTAFTSFIGLVPLLLSAGQTGKEILFPLSVVVFGGMLSSILLNQLVPLGLFFEFGKKVDEHRAEEIGSGAVEENGSVG